MIFNGVYYYTSYNDDNTDVVSIKEEEEGQQLHCKTNSSF